MKMIQAIIRPNKIEDVKKALEGFRFGGPAKAKPTKSQSELTETPKRLILGGLKAKPK